MYPRSEYPSFCLYRVRRKCGNCRIAWLLPMHRVDLPPASRLSGGATADFDGRTTQKWLPKSLESQHLVVPRGTLASHSPYLPPVQASDNLSAPTHSIVSAGGCRGNWGIWVIMSLGWRGQTEARFRPDGRWDPDYRIVQRHDGQRSNIGGNRS